MAKKTEMLGPDLMRNLEKQILLQAIDANWQEHRTHLDQLRLTIDRVGRLRRLQSHVDTLEEQVRTTVPEADLKTQEPVMQLRMIRLPPPQARQNVIVRSFPSPPWAIL